MAVVLAERRTGIDALREARERVEQAEASRLSDDRMRLERHPDRLHQRSIGESTLGSLRLQLFKALDDVAVSRGGSTEWVKGAGQLRLGAAMSGPELPYTSLDVFAWAPIEVVCSPRAGQAYRCSATLVYARKSATDEPRWMELAFFRPLLLSDLDVPFALDPSLPEFARALTRAPGAVSVAYGPIPIDGAGTPGFLDRWADMYASAILGDLTTPASLATPGTDRSAAARPLPLRLLYAAGQNRTSPRRAVA